MSWVRLDDALESHRKRKRAGHEAFGLWCAALTYCGRYHTDGLVDPEWLEDEVPHKRTRARLLERLVSVGLMDRLAAGDQVTVSDQHDNAIVLGPFSSQGFVVHDFLDLNPSSVEVEAKREQERLKKAAQRAASRGDTLGDTAGTGRGTPEGPPAGARPVPVPVPVPQEERKPRASQEEKDRKALNDLPDDLLPSLEPVRERLMRIAEAKAGAKLPTVAAVANVLRTNPHKDFIPAADDCEHYWVHGKGESRKLSDPVAVYRNFLGTKPDVLRRSEPAAPPSVGKFDAAAKRKQAKAALAMGRPDLVPDGAA